MRKISLCIAVATTAICFASCSQKEILDLPGQDVEASGQARTMTVSACIDDSPAGQNGSTVSKTALSGDDENGYDVVWCEGDEILIGGETFTLISGAGSTSGVFEGPELADGDHDAYYATSSKQIPTNQTFVAGCIPNSPMHATVSVTGGKAGKAEFKNIGGLLRLKLKNIQKAKVSNISVSMETFPSTTRILLDCGENGVELAEEGTTFYIAMPEGSFSSVSIDVTNIDNKTCSKSLKTGKSLTISHSEITDVALTVLFDGKYPTYHNGHEFVDLGLPSGLKWATVNIGAEDFSHAGSFYAWGETETKTTYSENNYSWPADRTITKENDAASVCWGGNWRMPTKAEVEELMQNCTWDLRNGAYKVKNDDSKQFIILPFTGIMKESSLENGHNGYYLTSDIDYNYPYALLLIRGTDYSYSFSCDHVNPWYGFNIRAVCE